jgi:hypothetical protein
MLSAHRRPVSTKWWWREQLLLAPLELSRIPPYTFLHPSAATLLDTEPLVTKVTHAQRLSG